MAWPLLLHTQQSSTSNHQSIDSTRQLQTIEITASPIREQTIGERRVSWQPADLQNHNTNHLGELLATESGVFVKSYGLGSSATTSIRGGSAGHTQVIWNGLPVENPMLGQLDFSLMPVGFVDEMSVAFGGNSAPWGSGAIGGTVFLNNKPVDREGFSISSQSEIGSFGWWHQQVKLQFGKGKWQQNLRYFHQQAENDFSYPVSPVLPDRKQENAAIQQNGLLHDLYWNPKSNEQFSIHTWLQKTNREIPPTTVQNHSEAEQKDGFFRTVLNWKRAGKKGFLSVRAGLFRERQEYLDPLINLLAENDFWKAMGEVQQQWHFTEKQKLQIGFSNTWIESDSKSYGQPRQENRTAVFALYRQEFGNWEAQLNTRQELVDGNLSPFIPGLGIQGALSDWLILEGKLTRNFRLPSLNDRYWNPGGNKNLKPEKGWSEELGLKVCQSNKLTYSITAFNRNIENWIQWSIREGESFYSPSNITAVWSRGIEQRLELKFHFKKTAIRFKGGYDFIKSTYQEAIENPSFDRGEQLIYTPEHQAFGNFQLKLNTFSMSYQHHFTGSVNTQNVGVMPNYQVGALRIENDWQKGDWNARLFFKIENLWNTKYRVIERRAMPGRYFRMGVKLRIEN